MLTGIGSGINVLTATRVNDFKTSYSILDRSALQQLNTSKAYVKEVTEYSYSISTGRSCAGGIVGIECDKSGEETYYYYNTITATLSALNFSGKTYISSHTGTLWGQQVSKNFEP